MLNYGNLDKNDERVQKIIHGLDEILANGENIVEKRHETYGDVWDDFEYIIWNRGIKVCRISGKAIVFGEHEEGVIMPNVCWNDIRGKLEKRCVKGEQAKFIEYNLLLARFARFRAR